jgi:hypothetical protein
LQYDALEHRAAEVLTAAGGILSDIVFHRSTGSGAGVVTREGSPNRTIQRDAPLTGRAVLTFAPWQVSLQESDPSAFRKTSNCRFRNIKNVVLHDWPHIWVGATSQVHNCRMGCVVTATCPSSCGTPRPSRILLRLAAGRAFLATHCSHCLVRRALP